MKPCVIITGPQAVGKMAVGMELRNKYDYRLFHNHMTIEFVKELYGVLNQDTWSMVGKLRKVIFDDVIHQDLQGFVFTYVWGFNLESEHTYVDGIIDHFESNGWQVYIVELEADVETRLARNKTELRLKHKATKRDIEWSDNELVKSMDKYRLNSHEGEIKHPRYMRINNTDIDPKDVAEMIYEYIGVNHGMDQ